MIWKLSAIFPNASQDCQKANPQLLGDMGNDLALGRGPTVKKRSKGNVERKRGIPNKTEAEFALRLEAMKRNGEILRYEFEGMTLRWAGMRYTPDFVVINKSQIGFKAKPQLSFIEVKGGHIWDRDIVRFKGARAHWPEFSFEMWQKTKQEWKRIH